MLYHTAMNSTDYDIEPLSPESLEGDAISFMANRAAAAAHHEVKVMSQQQQQPHFSLPDVIDPFEIERNCASFHIDDDRLRKRVAIENMQIRGAIKGAIRVVPDEVEDDVFVDCRESDSSSVRIVDSPHQSEVVIIEVEDDDVRSKSAFTKVVGSKVVGTKVVGTKVVGTKVVGSKVVGSRHKSQPLFLKPYPPKTNATFRTKKSPQSDSLDIYSTTSNSKPGNRVSSPAINYRDPLNLEESVKNATQYQLPSPSEYLNSVHKSPADFVLPSPELESTPIRPKKKKSLISPQQCNSGSTVADVCEQTFHEDEPSKHPQHSSTDEEDEEDNTSMTLNNTPANPSPSPSSSPDDRLDDLISKTIVELLPHDTADTRGPEISDNIKSYVRLKLLSRPELDSAGASDVNRIFSDAANRDHYRASIETTIKDIANESFLDESVAGVGDDEMEGDTHSIDDDDLFAQDNITYIPDTDTDDNMADDVSVTREEFHSELPQDKPGAHSIFKNVSNLSMTFIQLILLYLL